jgi:hypothetical protein
MADMHVCLSVIRTTALLMMVLAFSGGCATRAAWDDPASFQATVPIEIDVESFAGNVIINVTDRYPEVSVRVRRAAVHGFLRQREANQSLNFVNYTAKMEHGDTGPRLVVRTLTTHPEPHFQRAHVFIDVPSAENITVRTSRGNVSLRGVSGEISVETTHGDVRLVTNRALTRPVTILNQRGDIDFRVRGESQGSFDLQAIRGQVSRRINYGKLLTEPGSRHDFFRGRWNDGDNPVTMRTIDGNIRVSVVHNPEQVGMFIFN